MSSPRVCPRSTWSLNRSSQEKLFFFHIGKTAQNHFLNIPLAAVFGLATTAPVQRESAAKGVLA